MHPYTTDSNERKSIPILIAVLSVIAALTLGGFLEWSDFTIPWWFDSPAIIGFYGIFYCLFNKLLWKWKFFQKVRLVKLPNLNGTWKGYVTSSYDDHSEKYETTFTIQQDWNKIRIFGEFKMSQSYSLTASILIDDKTGITISYNYMNEPSPQAIKTMEIHHGFNILTLNPNGKEMSGSYYSGRGRQNIGEIQLEKV